MKPEFQISKNLIILLLSSLLFGSVFYIVSDKIERNVKEKTMQNENISPRVTYTPAENDFKEENTMLLKLLSQSEKEKTDLKRKVDYYFEFYRVNQPVGITVADDTVKIE